MWEVWTLHDAQRVDTIGTWGNKDVYAVYEDGEVISGKLIFINYPDLECTIDNKEVNTLNLSFDIECIYPILKTVDMLTFEECQELGLSTQEDFSVCWTWVDTLVKEGKLKVGPSLIPQIYQRCINQGVGAYEDETSPTGYRDIIHDLPCFTQ